MTENVAFTVEVVGNTIVLTPTSAIQDNYVYDIDLKGLVSSDGLSTLNQTTVSVTTELTPSYASVGSVLSLTRDCNIKTSDILYHIRDASRFVNFIKNGMPVSNPAPYEIEQFVRYKAAHDSVLEFYIRLAAEGGGKGQLGDVIYDNGQSRLKDISELLKQLQTEIDTWQSAVRGYKLEGRAKPLVALRSRLVQSPYQEYTPVNVDMNRGV
jgi:hypothetical protein